MAAAAQDEDGETRDRRRFEPGDGHPGLLTTDDMAKDEETDRYVVAGEDDGDGALRPLGVAAT